jgi:hAT family protein
MALDILSIPAMSAEPERVFSSIGIQLTNRRNKMTIEVLESLECLKSWLKLKDIVVDENEE